MRNSSLPVRFEPLGGKSMTLDSDELYGPRRHLLTHPACAPTQTTVLMDSPGTAAMAQVCWHLALSRAHSSRTHHVSYNVGPPRVSAAPNQALPPFRFSPSPPLVAV